MNRWNVISRLGLFLFLGITLAYGFAHSAAKLTLHGKILKPDNTPVNSSSVSFQIQIRSPGVENCLLYQETQTLNLSSNPGIFNLSIGSGTRPAATVDGGFTLNQIFQNRSLIDLSAAAGACTNPATSYTPAADDQRNISIQFNDGSGWQSVAIQKINPVPRALDSSKVGGYDSAQLLRVADGVPTAQTELSGVQWTELLAVISGTSTVYSKPNQLNGVNLPVLSNGQTMVWNAGAWTAVTPQALPGGGTNGQVLTSDGAGGATWTAAGSDASLLSSGTLNDSRLSSNVALKNASNTFSIGNQNITNGAATEVNLILKGAAAQSANMLEVRNSSNALLYSVETSGTPVANTDLANKAYVDSATSTVGANYVRKDGTTSLTGNWAVGNFDITGIKNIGTAGYFNQEGIAAPAVSAAGQGRIYFDSTSNTFKVSQNGGGYSDLVSGGANSWLQGGNAFGQTGIIGTSDAQDLRFDTNGSMRMTIKSSGDVGIGTNSPLGFFHVNGGSAAAATHGSSMFLYAQNAGTGNMTGGSINLNSGWGTGTGNGGGINIQTKGGASYGNIIIGTEPNGVSGDVFINGRQVNVNGGMGAVGGNVNFNAGNGTGGNGGTAYVVGGSSLAVNGDGGNANVLGGNGGSSTGNGGNVNIYAGNPFFVGSGNGGSVNLLATDAEGTNKNGGAITFRAGSATGTGVPGSFQFTNGYVGIGTATPSAALDINGAESMRGIAAPAVSAAGQGRIYFDSTSNKYQVSQNGGAYVDLVGGGGGATELPVLGGSAAAPGYAFSGNTNTGLFSSAANTLGLSTAGTERMAVDSSGRIGVGRSPAANTRMAVQGAVVSSTNIVASGATVDLSASNMHLLKSPGTPTITLQNMADGGTYTIYISDTTARTYVFSGCTNSYYNPANADTILRSAYTISVIDDGGSIECYISWSTGFN